MYNIYRILSILPLFKIVSIFPITTTHIKQINLSLKTLNDNYIVLMTRAHELSNIKEDMDEKLNNLISIVTENLTDVNTKISNSNYSNITLNRDLEYHMANLSEQISVEMYIISIYYFLFIYKL